MDRELRDSVERSTDWLRITGWLLLLLGLVAGQAWRTLGLYGAGPPWPNLWNDRPLVSGVHPQHLYHGQLGAIGLREAGTNCVYDPSFQAGYPKTPIFDGSRFAELILFALRDVPPATAYKVGLAGVCLLVPVLLLLACWGAGFGGPTAAVACVAGLVVWWGPPGVAALEAGDSEVFIASLAVLAHIGLLIRFDNDPGLRAWAGMLLTGALGWLAQPMLFPVVLPLLLIYYLSAGVKHTWPWHVALLAAECASLVINLPWLSDWLTYWWLRAPLPGASDLLPHRTIATFWNAPLWGGPESRALAIVIFASAAVGVLIWNETQQRPAARLLGCGAVGLLGLALLGISWEPLGQMGTSILVTPALWFACLPAAHAWTWILRLLAGSRPGQAVLILALAGLLGAGAWLRGDLELLARRCACPAPLAFGLGPEREELVETLRQYTTPDARILWEDRRLPRRASRWSALLPVLTERHFMGGLDPTGIIEHSALSFIDEALEGRHISTWSDKNLEEYCKRYHIGWVVAWSPSVIERFRAWPGVERERPVRDDQAGVFFTLKPQRSGYVTRGQAKVVRMDSRHITLADVVPDGGEVVLNLHYLTGLRAAPHRVQVEREPSGHDPIGFIRLKMTAPVPRLTLTWDRSHGVRR